MNLDRPINLTQLVKLSQVLQNSLDINEILNEVWQIVFEQLNTPMFFIGLYDELTDQVSFPIVYEDKKHKEISPIVLGEIKTQSLVTYVLKNREPLIFYNQAEKKELLKKLDIVPKKDGKECHCCWLYPLAVDNKLLGIFSIQSENDNAWGPESIEPIQVFVDMISHSIYNAQIIAQLKNNQQLFKDINTANREILSQMDPKMTLDKVVEMATKTLKAWRSNVILVNKYGDPSTYAKIGFDNWTEEHTYMREEGISKYVIRSRKAEFIDDVNSQAHRVNPGMIKDGVLSAVCLPLFQEGEICGVMWGQYNQRIQFSKELKDAWRLYANQATIAYKIAEYVSDLKITESLMSSSFDAVIVIDSNQNICHFNPQAEKLFSYCKEEIIGKKADVLNPSIEEAKRIHRLLIQDGHITNFQHSIKDKYGNLIPVSLSAKLVPGENGKYKYQVGYIRDLRKTRLMEDRLRALMASSKAINKFLKPKDIFRAVIKEATNSFPTAEGVAIHVFDEEKGLLIPISETGKPSYDLPYSFLPGEGIAGWVFKNNTPVQLDEAYKDKRYKSIEGSQHLSITCVPLTAIPDVIGVMTIKSYSTIAAFDDADLALLTAFADHVGVAIKNAQQFEEIQEVSRNREKLRMVSLEITKKRRVEEILQELAYIAKEELGVDVVVAHIEDEQSGRIITYSAPEEYKDLITIPRIQKDKEEKGFTNVILLTGETIVVDHAQSDRRVNPSVVEKGIRSFVGFPLIAEGGKVLGALFLNSTTQDVLSDKKKEIAFIDLLISQSASAIRKAILADSEARRMKKLELLSEASIRIIQTLHNRDEKIRYMIMLEYLTKLLDSEAASLLLVDETKPDHLILRAVYGHITENHNVGKEFKIHNENKKGLTGWIAYQKKLFKSHGNELRTHPAVTGKPAGYLKSGGCAALIAIPLLRTIDGQKELIGLLRVENKKNDQGEIDDSLWFTREDEWILNIFTETVMSSLERSRVYEQTRKRLDRHVFSLNSVYGTGRDVLVDMTLNETLQSIVRQAWELTRVTGKQAAFANIVLKENVFFRFVAAYPEHNLSQIVEKLGEKINIRKPIDGKIGVIGRSIIEGKEQLVGNVKNPPDRDYITSHIDTTSELVIPIKLGNEVLGAINVEHPDENAFDIMDVSDLKLLAIMAAITIRHHRTIEKLKMAQGRVESSAAMAVMSIAINAWYHSIRGVGINIRNQVDLMRMELEEKKIASNLRSEIDEELLLVKKLALKIINQKVATTLGKSRENILVTDFLEETILNFLKDKGHKDVKPVFEFPVSIQARAAITIDINPDFFRQALDIIIDNACEAMKNNLKPKILKVSGRVDDGRVKIVISDNGPGIPLEVKQKLFMEFIEKQPEENGLGIGMLLARAILLAYEGDIVLERSDAQGTSFMITLPKK